MVLRTPFSAPRSTYPYLATFSRAHCTSVINYPSIYIQLDVYNLLRRLQANNLVYECLNVFIFHQ